MSHAIAVSHLADIDHYAAIAVVVLLALYALRTLTGLLLAGLIALSAFTGRGHGQTNRRIADLAQRISPAFLRGTIVAITAASVSVTAGASAHASNTLSATGADRPGISDTRAPIGFESSPKPIVVVPERDGSQTPPAQPMTASPRSHVVKKGESLWSISADALGDRASPGNVARAWPDLYRANQRSIGADPNLVDVGLSLVLPDSLTAANKSPSITTTSTNTTQGCEAR